MSSHQPSLISGDQLAQYRFTLQALISERLTAIQEWAGLSAPGDEWELQRLLEELGLIAQELLTVGGQDDEVPF